MTKETAMKILKELHDNSLFSNRIALETLIPELADSKDEKVRKTIIRFFVDNYPNETEIYDETVTVGDAIAWLEKQGEQKSIDYNEELKKCRENPLYFFDKYVKLKVQNPAWSEEDEEMTDDLIKGCISAEKAHHFIHTSKEIADWLKSIKDRIGG